MHERPHSTATAGSIRDRALDLRLERGAREAGDLSVDRIDLCILKDLRRIIHAFECHSHQMAHDHDLTAPQLVCLLAIAERERISNGALARAVDLSPSTVVGIVDRLARKRLVDRQRDAHDRRVVNIVATDAGREAIRLAPSPLQGRLVEALSRLDDAERGTIARSLHRIAELMESESDASSTATAPLPRGPVDRV
ncbi:MAG: MarR family winged helix-turn-helix transcriptional regulator [Planctomycetota bacterium]